MIIPAYAHKTILDLHDLLKERTDLNLQAGDRLAGKLQKQTVTNLCEKNGHNVIDTHLFIPNAQKFRFDVTILNPAKREFSLAIYKKVPTSQDLKLILEELALLKEVAISRKEQDWGPTITKPTLYLQSGKIKTDTAKMRFVQAHLKSDFPHDLLELYRKRDFKIVGKGSYPDLPNWRDEAKRLGIAV